jgi:hypothetical protein
MHMLIPIPIFGVFGVLGLETTLKCFLLSKLPFFKKANLDKPVYG